MANPEPVTAAEIELFIMHARAFLARDLGDRNTGPGRYEAEVGIRLAEEVVALRAYRDQEERWVDDAGLGNDRDNWLGR